MAATHVYHFIKQECSMSFCPATCCRIPDRGISQNHLFIRVDSSVLAELLLFFQAAPDLSNGTSATNKHLGSDCKCAYFTSLESVQQSCAGALSVFQQP